MVFTSTFHYLYPDCKWDPLPLNEFRKRKLSLLELLVLQSHQKLNSEGKEKIKHVNPK